MASNARVIENADGLIRLAKPKGPAKIDGMVALAMSLGTHCKQRPHPEGEGLSYVPQALMF
jgi:phage terminase large subunit-like protein